MVVYEYSCSTFVWHVHLVCVVCVLVGTFVLCLEMCGGCSKCD